jgi:hypothetical protein
MTVALMITATSDITLLGKIHIATVRGKPDGSAWSHRDKTLSRFVLDPPPSSEGSPWVLIARVAAAAARAEESQ